MNLEKDPMYITGVAEAPLGIVQDHTVLSMISMATAQALAEAGLERRDIDGLFVNVPSVMSAVEVAEYMGLQPRYFDSTYVGGCSYELFVRHAIGAISAGLCDTALVAYANRPRTAKRGIVANLDQSQLLFQLEAPYGPHIPISYFALQAARHMHEFGTTSEQLAEVAVAAREWARLNPKAYMRDPLSIDDVLSSPMISTPLRKLDCCIVTDGGGALIICRKDRARNAVRKPVRVLGASEAHSHWLMSQMKDLTTTAAAKTGREAFAQAGIRPEDVDFIQPYDAFTICVIMALEDLGFCSKGEGGSFVQDGKLRPGGALPAMTNGGGLSYCHPGEYGILLLIEAVRQLRGEAGDRQVSKHNICVAHAIGGQHSTAATLVLARD